MLNLYELSNQIYKSEQDWSKEYSKQVEFI